MKSTLLGAVLSLSMLLGAHAAPAVTLELVGEGFVSPTGLQSLPGGDALLVSDQAGVVYKVKPGAPIEPWLDITSKLVKLNAGFDERGLLSMALHPDFAKNGRVFVVYTAPRKDSAPADWNHTWTLSEFSAEGGTAKLDSEKKLIEVDHPYFNHNGGMICFGPDGYLYASLGDGGGGPGGENDEKEHSPGHVPGGNAQSMNTLLGKIIRLDVSQAGVAGIPQDNPIAEGKGRREIYAWGLRNPWRMSFDRGGGRELYAADIGQELYEEVNLIKKGGNYGWPLREGMHAFNREDGRIEPESGPRVAADGSPLLDPIFEYKSYRSFPRDPGALGISITGGYVYRGKAIPGLVGKYVFADWSRNMAVADGVIYVGTRISPKGFAWAIERLNPASHPTSLKFMIPSFGEDAEGELYVLSNNTSQLINKSGKVWKIVPAAK